MAKAKKPVKKKVVVKKKTLPPGRKRASAVRKKTRIEKRPIAKPRVLKAVPDPKKKVDDTVAPGYVNYTLKKIANYERMHPNHNAAVNALTEAFEDGKRIAIIDEGIALNQIPMIWRGMADYIELDGSVVKDIRNKIGV